MKFSKHCNISKKERKIGAFGNYFLKQQINQNQDYEITFGR